MLCEKIDSGFETLEMLCLQFELIYVYKIQIYVYKIQLGQLDVKPDSFRRNSCKSVSALASYHAGVTSIAA
jgi:hypothetical protein